MTILDEIIAYKYKEVENKKEKVSIKQLERSEYFNRNCYSLKESLIAPNKSGIIAEFKRKSPSKGIINDTEDVQYITNCYIKSGASALSILTDEKYFAGSNKYLLEARKHNHVPILRKDFVVDEYQILEAKAIGADAILLIASALSKEKISQLSRLAKSLGFEILFEIHNESELEKVNYNVDIVGVNNRNLKTFNVDINTSVELSEKISNDFTKISESGISSVDTIIELKKYGYKGFLIGESFMKSQNPGVSSKVFIDELGKQ